MKKSQSTEKLMYFGTTPEILQLARQLRKNPTEAEEALWTMLACKKTGVKFRRQHAIGRFIADFYCHEKHLVIEVDGSIHSIDYIKERDEGRDFTMKQWGLIVLRFTNSEVLENPDYVMKRILHEIS